MGLKGPPDESELLSTVNVVVVSNEGYYNLGCLKKMCDVKESVLPCASKRQGTLFNVTHLVNTT